MKRRPNQTCPGCGARFYRAPSAVSNSRTLVYCSWSCRSQHTNKQPVVIRDRRVLAWRYVVNSPGFYDQLMIRLRGVSGRCRLTDMEVAIQMECRRRFGVYAPTEPAQARFIGLYKRQARLRGDSAA